MTSLGGVSSPNVGDGTTPFLWNLGIVSSALVISSFKAVSAPVNISLSYWLAKCITSAAPRILAMEFFPHMPVNFTIPCLPYL